MDLSYFKLIIHNEFRDYVGDTVVMQTAYEEAKELGLSADEIHQYCTQIKPHIPIIEAALAEPPYMANIFMYAREVFGPPSPISSARQPVVDLIKRAISAQTIFNLSHDLQTHPLMGSNNTHNPQATELGAWHDPLIRFEKKGQKNGYNYFALYDYYSKKDFPSLAEPHHNNRLEVWRFKDGNASEIVACKIASALYNQYPGRLWSAYQLCIIPASTVAKTHTRFARFSDHMVEYLGMKDGYSAILTYDHEATKGNANKDILPFLEFVPEDIVGQKILLFDDVKTTGRSFYQCASELVRLGAQEVTGVFLAQTVSTFTPVAW